MKNGTHIHSEVFNSDIQKHLRASGHSQKELADEIGLHPKVLSRKLHGSSNAHLTHLEVRRIITALARWHVIATQDEAFQLLQLAGVGPAIFQDDEWEKPPLNELTKKRPAPAASDAPLLRRTASMHNLPSLTTRVIGREWAIARLQQLLTSDDVRLITLVGPGGSGKTRLALHTAGQLVDKFAQGVWFVPLSGINDPAFVPISILQALNVQSSPGVPPLQTIVTYLRNRQVLLVLDNFEHIVDAANAVDEMLTAVPGLKILVTSRVVLHLYGEHEFSVPPLDLPDPGNTLEPAELMHYEAIQLFVERAQAVMPTFALTEANALTVARICARIDGLPLATELAAARVKVLPPALLLERLAKARLPVLTGGARNLPGRQQTLRNTIMWSDNLLSPTEQAWFHRLGIFAGGWSLEAIEVMMQSVSRDQEMDAAASPLDILEQLVDNSLLIRLPFAHGQARFAMLETLREYVLERLAAQGEVERLRDWHACYYLCEAEAAELGLRGPQQLMWLERLTAERDNFRAALEWSLQRAKEGREISAFPFFGQEQRTVAGSKILSTSRNVGSGLSAIELCLRLSAALRSSWEWQGYLTEARHWLGTALEVYFERKDVMHEFGETVLAAQAKALSEYSRLTCLQDDQPRAIELVEQSLAIWRQLDDSIGLAAALLHRGWAAHAMNQYEVARKTHQEGLRHLSMVDDPWLYGQLLFYVGAALAFMGDFEGMRSHYGQGRKLFEQIGDASAVADVLKDQGGLALLEGNCAEAIRLLTKSIHLCYELNHRQYMTTGLCLLSMAFGLNGEPDPYQASIYSAQLEGVADSLMETIGLKPWTKNNPFAQMIQQQIRSRVDEQSWEAGWTAGRALTLEQAIDLVDQLAGNAIDS